MKKLTLLILCCLALVAGPEVWVAYGQLKPSPKPEPQPPGACSCVLNSDCQKKLACGSYCYYQQGQNYGNCVGQ